MKIAADIQISTEWQKITEQLKQQIIQEREDCSKDIDDIKVYYDQKIRTMQFEIDLLKKEVEILQGHTPKI